MHVTERGGLARVARPVAFVVAYHLAARLSEGLTLESDFTPWYPPAGLVLAYLIIVGWRGAGTVLVARLVNVAILFPDAWRDEPDGVLVRALAITAVYTIAGHLLGEIARGRAQLRELGQFIVIGVLGAPAGAALAAAVVSSTLLDTGWEAALDVAGTVWIGDAVAVATLVPAIVAIHAHARATVRRRWWPRHPRARLELVALVASMLVVPILALAIVEDTGASAFLAIAVVPVVWSALRGDLLLAAVGLLVVNVTLSIAASAALGATTRVSELQLVMLGSALAAMYVAAVTHAQQLMVVGLLQRDERYRAVVDQAPSLIMRFGLDGALRFTNSPQWALELGHEHVTTGLLDDWATVHSAIVTRGEAVDRDWDSEGPDGRRHWFSARLGPELGLDGAVDGVVAVVTDHTSRRRAEHELDEARSRDPLTGLVNRARFLQLLELTNGEIGDGCLGVALVDIDAFKLVNERGGHGAGDEVLVAIARCLEQHVGDGGVVARLGADEFAVARACTHAEEMADLGAQLVAATRTRVPIAGSELLVTCSVGVACGTDGRDPESVVHDAERALHAAKEQGRDRHATFEASHRLAAVEREERLSLIRDVLERKELVVHYQPLVDLRSGEVVSVEALVRLPQANDGLLFPAAFIDLVEGAGLDAVMGAQVLERSVQDLRGWPVSDAFRVSVNVTAGQLARPGYAEQVLAACQAAEISPARLCLELTETMVLAEPDVAIGALRELRACGVSIALDDFGVGYSSMVYLQRLPVSVLKIDMRFVAGLPDDPDARAIVGLIVGLADAMGLAVTAEGIETEAQQSALIELGCTVGQGFLFSRPVPAADLRALVSTPVGSG